MLIYIVSYIFSLLFTYLASKNKKNYFFHILAVLMPILLLTFRDVTVGTDTGNYLSIFQRSKEFDLPEFLLFSRIESLYAIILFYVAKLEYSYSVLLFVLALFTVIPVYIASFRMKDKVSPSFMMFLYYMMYYQYAFNISRQAIAMSLIVLATTYLLENKKLPVIILCLLALGFHNITVLYCAIAIFYFLKNRGSLFMKCFIFLLLLGIYVLMKTEISYYQDVYLSGGNEGSGLQMSYTVSMFFNLFFIISAKNDNYYLTNKKAYIYLSLLVIFLNLTSLISVWFFRISLFVDILNIICIANVVKSEIIHKKSYKYLMYICYAIFFWLFVFIINNSGETFPYIFVF